MRVLDQLDWLYNTVDKAVGKTLEWCSEKFPTELQDKVWTAYLGRAASLNLPQLAKTLWQTYRTRSFTKGMRADPIVARQELREAEKNWDEVMEEDRIQTERIRREQTPTVPEQSDEVIAEYMSLLYKTSRRDVSTHGDYRGTYNININSHFSGSRLSFKEFEPSREGILTSFKELETLRKDAFKKGE